jgi:hypothetical protein
VIQTGQGGSSTRDLRLRLTVDAVTGQANQAMAGLAQQARTVAAGASAAHKELASLYSWGAGYDKKTGEYIPAGQSYDQDVARRMGRQATQLNGSNAPGKPGLVGRAAGALGIPTGAGAAVAAVAVVNLFNDLSAASKVLHDEMSSGRDAMMAYARAIPFIGEAVGSMIADLHDLAQYGGYEGIAAADRNLRMRQAMLSAVPTTLAFQRQNAARADEIGTADRAYQNVRNNPLRPYLGDPTHNAYDAARAAAAAETERAMRARNLAAGEAEDATNKPLPLTDRRLENFRRSLNVAGEAAQGLQNGIGNRRQLQESVILVEETRLLTVESIEEAERRVTEAKKQQINLAQQEYELAKARTAEAKALYDEVSRKEKLVRGAGGEFAMMASDQRGRLTEAIRTYEREGFKGSPVDVLQQLASNPLTQERVRKDAEREGANLPGFDEVRKFGGFQGANELAQMREKLKVGIQVKMQLDEEQLAKAMADIIRDFEPILKKLAKQMFEINLRDFAVNQLKTKATKGD